MNTVDKIYDKIKTTEGLPNKLCNDKVLSESYVALNKYQKVLVPEETFRTQNI